MIKSIVAFSFVAATLTTPSVGQAQPKESAIHQLCPLFGDLAEQIMDLRQSGTPMSTVIQALTKNRSGDSTDSSITDMSVTMAKMAYEKPRYSSDEYQKKAVQDFRNDIESLCYK